MATNVGNKNYIKRIQSQTLQRLVGVPRYKVMAAALAEWKFAFFQEWLTSHLSTSSTICPGLIIFAIPLTPVTPSLPREPYNRCRS